MSGQQNDRPPSQFSDEQVVNWLIDECRDVGSRVLSVTSSGDRILAAGSTVIALATTVAIGGGKSYLLMWLPLGVAIVIVYGLFLNNMARALIGYQVGLEREIDRRVGVPLIAWQSRVIVRPGSSGPIRSVHFLGVAVYAASAGLGLAQALHTLSPGAWGHERSWLYVTLTAVGIVACAGAIGYCYWQRHATISFTAQRVADLFPAGREPQPESE